MPFNVNIFNKELIPVQGDYTTYNIALTSDIPDLTPYATVSQLNVQASRFINYLPLSGGTLTGSLTAQNVIMQGLTARGNIALVGSISGTNSTVSFNTAKVTQPGGFGAGSSTVAGPNAAGFGLNTYVGSEGGYAAGSQTSVGYGVPYSSISNSGGGLWQITTVGGNFFNSTDVGMLLRAVITDDTGGEATPTFVLCEIQSVITSTVIVVRVINGTMVTSSKGYLVHAKFNSNPGGFGATALGFQTVSIGDGSFSTGMLTAASGLRAVAMGYQTKAYGDQSMALGNNTIARANNSVAVGYATLARGDQAYAEGNDTRALGNNSHTEGYQTSAFGNESHAEGFRTQANAFASHAEGIETIAGGIASHAAGVNAQALQDYTYAWSDGNLWTAGSTAKTTRTGQFMVSASGGVFIPGNVGIGTDNNTYALSVTGITVLNTLTANNITVTDTLSVFGTTYFVNTSTINYVTAISSTSAFLDEVYTKSLTAEKALIYNQPYVKSDAFIANTGFVIADTSTNRIFSSSDNGKCITFSNTTPVTASLPAGLPVGFNALLLQINTGQVFVSAGPGVTVNSDGGKRKIASQHSSASLISYAADTFNLAGNLTT